MNAYSTIRNTGFATILVAALAGIVSNALEVDQKIVYERDVPEAAAVTAVLPEVVVSATPARVVSPGQRVPGHRFAVIAGQSCRRIPPLRRTRPMTANLWPGASIQWPRVPDPG